MSDTPPASAPPGAIVYPLLVPLLLNTVAVQTAVAMLRITTSYRAIELELSVVWLGVISAAIAVPARLRRAGRPVHRPRL